MMMTVVGGSNNNGNVVDTMLTKVFVGGLAWETLKEAMRDHFHKYMEILEAFIISDKLTGRSKGYGFVSFKDAEAARKACEDPVPIINGWQDNCNLAALGAKRAKSSTNTPAAAATTNPPRRPPQQGPNIRSRVTIPFAQGNHVKWYYLTRAQDMASPFLHPHQHQAIHYYDYTPPYFTTTDCNFNIKLGYNGRTYMNGHFSQVYPGQAMIGGNNIYANVPSLPYPTVTHWAFRPICFHSSNKLDICDSTSHIQIHIHSPS